MNPQRAQWGSRLAFILAAAGSAIGLGNLWKFPYVTGINGGGAFVLVYLICILFVGVPVLLAELYIGQQSQTNTVNAFEVMHKKRTLWQLPGWMGIISAFLILSFYSVVGGWILDFTYHSVLGTFSGAPENAKTALNSLFQDPLRQTLWHFLFMFSACAIVIGGIKEGLEKWNKILMPTLLILLLALLVKSFFLNGFSQAIDFLFEPNFSMLTSESILEAVGHSFFTLSLGMGAIITYGSYLSKKEDLVKVSFALALLDTLIALVAGLVIFSIVFSFDLEPASGPGLIFATLPTLFSQMPGGYFLSLAFFILVGFAALTSAVSILEVQISYLTDKHKISRKKLTAITAAITFLTGLLSVFSTNIMSDIKIFDLTFFDLFDKLTSNYLLPIGGLIISLFFGWVLGPKATKHICGKSRLAHLGLLWITRIIAPFAILLVIYNLTIGF